MDLKHLMFVFVIVLGAMYFITEQDLDYQKFVKLVRTTVSSDDSKEDESEPTEKRKHYGGVFTIGNCVRLDDTDYFKIVDETASNYLYVLCKFEGKCLTTPAKAPRTDFEIANSHEDIILCPMEN